MNARERVSVLQRGLAVLERVRDQWRAVLPHTVMPGQPPFEELRTIDRLLAFLEYASGSERWDEAEVQWLDATLSMVLSAEDASFIRAVVDGVRAGQGPELTLEERDVLIRLARLFDRYVAQELMPPSSYFGISDREA